MGHEEQAEEAIPEAAWDVCNTWSAMSLGGHIEAMLAPSVSLLTTKCMLRGS